MLATERGHTETVKVLIDAIADNVSFHNSRGGSCT